jgi:hypothetical protein
VSLLLSGAQSILPPQSFVHGACDAICCDLHACKSSIFVVYFTRAVGCIFIPRFYFKRIRAATSGLNGLHEAGGCNAAFARRKCARRCAGGGGSWTKGLVELQLHWRVNANCAQTFPNTFSLQKSLNDALNTASGESFAPRGRDDAGRSCQSETRATSEGEGHAGEEMEGGADTDDEVCHEDRICARSRGSGSPTNQSNGKGATYLSALLLPKRREGGERQTYRLCGAKYSRVWLWEDRSSDSQDEHASKLGSRRRKGRPLESAKLMLLRGCSLLNGGFDTSTSYGGMLGGIDDWAA